jgi:hypothetical protein
VVTLDDRTRAVVVHVDDEQVYRPVVRRLADPRPGQVLPQLVGDAVDLRIDPSRQIIELMGVPTSGLLCSSQTLDAIARLAEDPADREEVTALRGEDAERAYARRPRTEKPTPAAPGHARTEARNSTAGSNRGGRQRHRDGVEDIPELDLTDLSPSDPGTSADSAETVDPLRPSEAA